MARLRNPGGQWQAYSAAAVAALLVLHGCCGPVREQSVRRDDGLPDEEDDRGFVDLLSPARAGDWRQCGPGRFVVLDGVAAGEGGMGLWWYSGRTFEDFVLRGEFVQEQPIADSGIFLRFPDPGGDPWVAVNSGHEMEIGDPDPADPTWRTGSIYPFCASARANANPPGQWNRYEIACIGHRYRVRINGETVLDWTDPKERTLKGYIGLQNYPDDKVVRHRRLRILPLTDYDGESSSTH